GACLFGPGAVRRWSRRCSVYHVCDVSTEGHIISCFTQMRTFMCPCMLTCFFFSSSRSNSFPFSDSPLYSQTPPTSSSAFYEATPSSESDITGSGTSQPVSVATAGANSGVSAAGAGGFVQGGYMLGGGASTGGGGGQSYTSPNSRAPPATVQWLLENYEGAEGVSLPRCTLYYHYILHCQEQKLEPVNAASFGKLIRSVFMGLRTRRLGTSSSVIWCYASFVLCAVLYLICFNRIKPLQKTQGIANGTSGAGQQQVALSDISAQVQHLLVFGIPPSQAVLDVMINLQFTLVETLWKSFWRFSQNNDAESLNLSCLVALCKFEPVLRWTRECDNLLYQTLVEILIPDVLRPIPSKLVVCIGSFSQTLRRYTSLNHLAQAARAVLQNSAQINQMLSDLNRVDFTNVQEQASWVCQCEDRVVQRLEQDFKATLQQQNSLEQWASWLDGVVSQVLKPYEQNPVSLPKAAKVFLLNWSFYR
ncbi:hypothetical protein GOODEAATRI_001730, partial [Goodea atripinnis]